MLITVHQNTNPALMHGLRIKLQHVNYQLRASIHNTHAIAI